MLGWRGAVWRMFPKCGKLREMEVTEIGMRSAGKGVLFRGLYTAEYATW
jgi:hypothetical protein